MLRVLFVAFALVGFTASSACAQSKRHKPVAVSSWVTELGAGAGLDLAARGPWMAPEWRTSASRRVLVTLSASLMYEYVVEPWNGHTNAAKWSDVGQRLVGTVGTEILIAVIKGITD